MPRVLSPFFITLLLWTVAAAESDSDGQFPAAVDDETYVNGLIGWSMPIPQGWSVMSTEKVAALEAKGQEAISEMEGAEASVGGMINFLNLHKGEKNAFQSSGEPFLEAYQGEWEDVNAQIKELLFDTYLNAGLGVEVTDTITETIDGVTFQFHEFTIFAPNGNEILRQRMYYALIKGYDFGASLSFDSEATRDELLDAWRASKFEKTE